MKVTLKLFATLADHLPAGAEDNQAQIEVAEGESVAEVIARLALPPGLVHLVLVNGSYVAPEARGKRRLSAGDQLALWPPIAGG